jgi:hypothetical protein
VSFFLYPCRGTLPSDDIGIDLYSVFCACTSSIDLPNIVAGIYNEELCDRLRSFLVACPPPSPTPHVAELMIATADFQQDLISWGIK